MYIFPLFHYLRILLQLTFVSRFDCFCCRSGFFVVGGGLRWRGKRRLKIFLFLLFFSLRKKRKEERKTHGVVVSRSCRTPTSDKIGISDEFELEWRWWSHLGSPHFPSFSFARIFPIDGRVLSLHRPLLPDCRMTSFVDVALGRISRSNESFDEVSFLSCSLPSSRRLYAPPIP